MFFHDKTIFESLVIIIGYCYCNKLIFEICQNASSKALNEYMLVKYSSKNKRFYDNCNLSYTADVKASQLLRRRERQRVKGAAVLFLYTVLRGQQQKKSLSQETREMSCLLTFGSSFLFCG